MAKLLRHRQTKGAATDRLGLRDAESCSLLYPLFPSLVLEPTAIACTSILQRLVIRALRIQELFPLFQDLHLCLHHLTLALFLR
jgi:hypothetical protein